MSADNFITVDKSRVRADNSGLLHRDKTKGKFKKGVGLGGQIRPSRKIRLTEIGLQCHPSRGQRGTKGQKDLLKKNSKFNK